MMPLKFTTKWPKGYGFEIYGKGPCYVTFIEKGSVAHNAGLLPGDQILELDGQDATMMSSEALKTLAKHSREQPPSLEVVSCLKQVHIPFKGIMGYGFTLVDGRPVVVAGVDFGSPAYKAGLRTGDVILEINGKPTFSLQDVGKLQKLSHLSLLTIPIGRASNMIQVKKSLPKSAPAVPRIQRARELHDKMNIILGDDYEKKMAIVGILKQYAEDRDIQVFCEALGVVLKTPHQRRLLKQIRPFVPPNHRNQFDQLIRMKNLSTASSISSVSAAATNKPGQTRVVQILRDDGSFGFVIKGSNPAYIESVDPGGPAEHSGLQPKDYIMKLNGIDVRRCGHSRLIQLLQDSGTAPTIEILRYYGGMTPAMSLESLSSDSDTSSHTSTEWLTQQKLVDKDGRTFKERITFLLTPKERSQLKRSLLTYEVTSDVVEVYTDVSAILDTPSKKTLWMFIMTKLPIQHQEYCLHRIDLPQHVLLEVVRIQRHGNNLQQNGNEDEIDWDSAEGYSELSPSFQQQIDFLLTSEERSLLKRLLYVYEDDREIKSLLEEMELMLDTPSKKTLWRYIIPLLTNQHQDIVRRRLEFKQQYIESQLSQAMDSYIGPDQVDACQHVDHGTNTDGPGVYVKKHDGHSVSSEDGNDSTLSNDSVSGWRPRSKSSHHMEASEEVLLKELEETRRVIQEAKLAIVQNTEQKVTKSHDSSDSNSSRYVTIIPVGYPGFEDANHPYCMRELNSPDFNKFRKLSLYNGQASDGEFFGRQHFQETVDVSQRGNQQVMDGFNRSEHPNSAQMIFQRSEEHTKGFHKGEAQYLSSSDGPDVHHQSSKGFYREDDQYSSHFHQGEAQNTSDKHFNQTRTSDPDFTRTQQSSDTVYNRPEVQSTSRGLQRTDSHNSSEASSYRKDIKQSSDKGFHWQSSHKSDRSFHGESRPMSSSGSEVELVHSSAAESGDSFKKKALHALQELDAVMACNEGVADNPAPPPPPPPPGAPPLLTKKSVEGQMNVKRINWEKMDNTKVGNTVWGQLADHDLEHVVKHLELESQFSTKSNKAVFSDRRQEVCILSPKKAYNMSILLGHLKMSVSEVKHALYSMNEEILSPELVKQLLAYAPSSDELERYDNFTGEVEDMSKPDMFAYEMSRIPGYEQRLQAMLFRATFKEKIMEMRENLRCIKTASYELKHSKKLAKLLELILAMGNYLNKGNVRVGEASGFHINFLTQLDVTKTSDNKSTFLHVLAGTVSARFPEVLTLGEELHAIPEAAKVSSVLLNQELQELRKVLQDISNTLEKLSSHQIVPGMEDKFQDVMGHFIAEASDDVQSILRLQATAMDEFHAVTAYFGEDSKKLGTSEFFGIFSDFLVKFEKAHHHNLMHKRH